MTAVDAQIEIALLVSVERQAKRTAAALERVLRLMRESARMLREVERLKSNHQQTN